MKKNTNSLLLELQKYPLLVAALDGDDLPFLLEQAKTLRVDMVELRMDVWQNFFREDMLQKLARFKQKIALPMLVSFRGGHPFPKWWQPLHWRALASVDMIDVEWNSKYPWRDIRAQTQNLNLGLMISHHDYDKTPPLKTLQAIAKGAIQQGAQVVKFATKIIEEADIRTLMDVNRSLGPNTLGTVMGMGAWAGVSRLTAPLYGSCLVYGFIGAATAIGQSPYKELQERMRSLNPRYEAGFLARQKKRGLL